VYFVGCLWFALPDKKVVGVFVRFSCLTSSFGSGEYSANRQNIDLSL
jgi:hypothetical protein